MWTVNELQNLVLIINSTLRDSLVKNKMSNVPFTAHDEDMFGLMVDHNNIDHI